MRAPHPRRAGRVDTGTVVIDTLGGYRLLRTLGAGSRAEVYLAHPLREGAATSPAVLKIYGEAVSDESIVAEIEALSRAAGEHVVRVLDVTSTPDGAPALVLSRHAAGSLARLLADRSELREGEAITILAPLAATLARLHGAGVAHGSVRPGSVLFDPAGSPTLACFGRAALFPAGLPPVALEAEQAVIADVLGFGELAATVLERAGSHGAAHRARTEAAPGAWLEGFADELFDLAAPLPVDLRSPLAVPEQARIPARVLDPRERGGGVGTERAGQEPPASRRRAGWRRWRAGVARALRTPVPQAPVLRVRGLLVRGRESLRGVRRGVWVVAGVSLVALVAALALVQYGSPGDEAARRGVASARDDRHAGAGMTGSGPTGGGEPGAEDPGAQDPGAEDPVVADPGAAVTADDPVAAVVVLLEAREGCIRDLSVECLAEVDQQGSSALEADAGVIREALRGAGTATSPRAEGAALAQRLGDSALVALGPDSEPASVLLVKGEAGWRIRDYLSRG